MGLWPFDFFPENKALFLKERPGILFQERSFAHAAFKSAPGRGGSGEGLMSIGAVLEPMKEPDNHIADIVSFYGPRKSEVFSLSQWRSELILRRFKNRGGGYREYSAGDILFKGKTVSIVVTLDADAAIVYMDGRMAMGFPGLEIDTEGLSGLVAGNSPTGENQWDGKVYALSFYGRALEKERAIALSLLQTGPFDALKKENPSILYLFGERGGGFARNVMGTGSDLKIPEVFRAVEKKALLSPFEDIRSNRLYIRDIAVNIAGFIPLGFFFSALAFDSLKRGARGPAVFSGVVFFGALVSLSIELTQVYLPSRTPSAADLIDNTLGAAAGAYLHTLMGRIRRYVLF